MGTKAIKATIILGLILFSVGVFMFAHKLSTLEKRYENIETKIAAVETLQQAHEEALEKKIEDIKTLQAANDKKLKEVTNATFQRNYKMSDDDVVSGWDNFMSELRTRNSNRNIY